MGQAGFKRGPAWIASGWRKMKGREGGAHDKLIPSPCVPSRSVVSYSFIRRAAPAAPLLNVRVALRPVPSTPPLLCTRSTSCAPDRRAITEMVMADRSSLKKRISALKKNSNKKAAFQNAAV